MVYFIHRLTNSLFLGIPLYYCTNFNLSIICYLSSRDIYLLNVNINSSIIPKNMHPFLVLTLIPQKFIVFLLEICIFSYEQLFPHFHHYYYQVIIQKAIPSQVFSRICYFISNFITNQITSCFCCFLNCSFRCSFYCICCRFFSAIKTF